MKAVLISIQPKWCELIANGKKTVEVRKIKPRLKTPFKVYIYCTKGRGDCLWRWGGIWYDTQDPNHRPNRLDGKVIGEFVCNEIEELRYDALEMTYMARKYRDINLLNEEFFKGTQVTYQEAYDYCEGMTFDEEDTDYFYGWHISDLVIYDKPRELSEFYYPPEKYCEKDLCGLCPKYEVPSYEYGEVDFDCEWKKPIERPPQSWMYVEALQ